VHSVTLVPTSAEALDFPRGDIALGACRDCKFIHNTAFDPKRLAYYSDYESTQAYSSTFNAFHADLAKRLVQRYDLHGKELIEIGCGHGEFLTLLCDYGGNRGTGFDPAYLPGRRHSIAAERTTFIKDYYSEAYSQYRSDFLCCKMTLEHIQDTAEFVRTVRRSLGDRTGTTVFFQVPDATRILRESAFWDIYYEHCSYFTGEALQNLFRLSDFDVIDSRTEYDGQYLMIEARPGDLRNADAAPHAPQATEAGDDAAAFAKNIAGALEDWRQVVRELHRTGRRAVVWGGGSKAVAFLTTLGVRDEIDYAVDINPHKHHTFLAGTGQEVVAPEFLKEYRPDAVIAMNPVYCREIEAQLNRLGVTADLIPLEPPAAQAGDEVSRRQGEGDRYDRSHRF
jgi:hypothetical protein